MLHLYHTHQFTQLGTLREPILLYYLCAHIIRSTLCVPLYMLRAPNCLVVPMLIRVRAPSFTVKSLQSINDSHRLAGLAFCSSCRYRRRAPGNAAARPPWPSAAPRVRSKSDMDESDRAQQTHRRDVIDDERRPRI